MCEAQPASKACYCYKGLGTKSGTLSNSGSIFTSLGSYGHNAAIQFHIEKCSTQKCEVLSLVGLVQ